MLLVNLNSNIVRNFDTTINNQHVTSSSSTSFAGPTVDGNVQNVNRNFNAGFQCFACLQNLNALQNMNSNIVRNYDTTINNQHVTSSSQTTFAGPTVDGNVQDVKRNFNAGFQCFAC